MFIYDNQMTEETMSQNHTHVCAYHCAQLLYTTHCRTTLIIFPRILQTIIVAQMMSTGGEGIFPEELTTTVQQNVDDYISKVRINTWMTFLYIPCIEQIIN